MAELEREARIIDMMLTAHSELRDRYHRRALAIDVASLCLSVLLCASVFVDPTVVTRIGLSLDSFRIATGLVSVLMFMASVVSLRVNWKPESANHAQACDVLSSLKGRYRGADDGESRRSQEECRALQAEYHQTMAALPKIPEREFHRLKALHLRKIELSKLISANPGASVLLLRLVLWWRSNRHAVRGGSENQQGVSSKQ